MVTSRVDELFNSGARLTKEMRLAKPDDLIVMTGGVPIGVAGTTNLLKVEKIDERGVNAWNSLTAERE